MIHIQLCFSFDLNTLLRHKCFSHPFFSHDSKLPDVIPCFHHFSYIFFPMFLFSSFFMLRSWRPFLMTAPSAMACWSCTARSWRRICWTTPCGASSAPPGRTTAACWARRSWRRPCSRRAAAVERIGPEERHRDPLEPWTVLDDDFFMAILWDSNGFHGYGLLNYVYLGLRSWYYWCWCWMMFAMYWMYLNVVFDSFWWSVVLGLRLFCSFRWLVLFHVKVGFRNCVKAGSRLLTWGLVTARLSLHRFVLWHFMDCMVVFPTVVEFIRVPWQMRLAATPRKWDESEWNREARCCFHPRVGDHGGISRNSHETELTLPWLGLYELKSGFDWCRITSADQRLQWQVPLISIPSWLWPASRVDARGL